MRRVRVRRAAAAAINVSTWLVVCDHVECLALEQVLDGVNAVEHAPRAMHVDVVDRQPRVTCHC